MWRENRLHERYESEVKLKLEHKDELNSIHDSLQDEKDDERSMSDDYDYGYTQDENKQRLHDYQPNHDQDDEYLENQYYPNNQGKQEVFISLNITSKLLQKYTKSTFRSQIK